MQPLLINSAYRTAVHSRHRYLLLFGGAGSGKSYAIAQKFIMRLLTEENQRFMFVRNKANSIRNSMYSLMKELVYQYDLESQFDFLDSQMRIICRPTKNEIISYGCTDTERLKSVSGITGTWLEEASEIREKDFDQIDLRLRNAKANYEQHILSFNPIDENHWLRKRFFDEHDNPRNADVCLIKTTYKDNAKNLPPKYIETLLRFKETNPAYYAVYAEGAWGNLNIGFVFKAEHYAEYNALPADLRSVIYCDPNLSLQEKGDTTAITCLGFSAETQKYYIVDTVCRSFSDANDLLRTVLAMKSKHAHCVAVAFDGNVTQEATYTNFIRNYSRQIGAPIRIEFKRYRVDDLAKSAQIAWSQGLMLFPDGFSKSIANKEYLSQCYNFQGKKAKLKDDAPDSLICAFEFLHERNLARKAQTALLKNYS